MATYFGEILPVSSRAVDDDDDEDETVLNNRSIKFEWISDGVVLNEPEPYNCKNVIIGVGNTACAFIDVYIMKNDHAKQMKLMLESDPSENTPYQKPMKLSFTVLQLDDVAVVVCKESLPAEYSFMFVLKLFEKVKLDQGSVHVLCSAPVNDYKCSTSVSELKIPFLRCLCSSAFASQPVCPYLEQPNTVSALPAQILAHCEINQIPAVLYQTFTESVYLDADSIKSFKKTVLSLPLSEKLEESVDTKHRIVKLTSLNAQKNLLYL